MTQESFQAKHEAGLARAAASTSTSIDIEAAQAEAMKIMTDAKKLLEKDAETNETFEAHEVDGQIVVLDNGRSAVAETVAAAAIERARKDSCG
jgi:hypothetical protein